MTRTREKISIDSKDERTIFVALYYHDGKRCAFCGCAFESWDSITQRSGVKWYSSIEARYEGFITISAHQDCIEDQRCH